MISRRAVTISIAVAAVSTATVSTTAVSTAVSTTAIAATVAAISATVAISISVWLVALVGAAGDGRPAPCVVEPFPLGVEFAPAVAEVLHAVGRVGRTVGASQHGARAAVAAGHLPRVGQRFDRRLHRVLSNANACVWIVTIATTGKDPTVLFAAALGCTGIGQQRHGNQRQGEKQSPK